LALVGLVAATVTAVVTVALYLSRPATPVALDDPAPGPTQLSLPVQVAVDVLALMVTGGGLALIEVAASRGRWRRAGWRFGLLSLVAIATAGLAVLSGPLLRPEFQLVGQPALVLAPLISLAAIAVALGRRWRATATHPAVGVVLLLPFAAIPLTAALIWVGSGSVVSAALYLHRMVDVVGNVAVVGGVAMLMWLAFEGLRMSVDAGSWLLERVSATRLANSLLLVKALALMAFLIALDDDGGAGVPRAPEQLSTGLIAALPAAALLFLPLVWETRMVKAPPERFPQLARTLGLASIFWLLPVLVLVPLPLVDLALSRWSLSLLVAAAAVLGLVAGATLDHRHRWSWRVSGATAALGVLVWSAWAARRPLSAGVTVPQTPFVLVLLVSAAAVLLGLLVLAHVSWLRAYRGYLWVALGWLVLAVLAPASVSPLALDLAILLGAGVLFLLRRAGWVNHPVSDLELALLLVSTAFLIELPLLLEQAPPTAAEALVVLAFLGPGITTLNARPLNRAGPGRSARVISTIGALCLGYGLVLALVVAAPHLLPVVQDETDELVRSVALPLVVVLVAATSLQRRTAAASQK
jgi:hypothetical protein